MRSALLLPLALLLAACGSNVPPPEDQGGRHDMAGMAMPVPTGDQDRDFAKAMIVHHQGAIDMARTQLARGKDAEMRKLASEVVAAQEREIRQLNAYLDRSGGR